MIVNNHNLDIIRDKDTPFLYLYLVSIFFFLFISWIGVPLIFQIINDSYHLYNKPDLYFQIAQNVAQGHGFRISPDTGLTAIREPTYIYVLSILIAAFGNDLLIAILLNNALTILNSWVIILLSKNMGLSKRVQYTAAILYLINPVIIGLNTRAGVDIMFNFISTLALASLFVCIHSSKLKWFVITGCLMGLAILTRGSFLVFALMVIVYLFFAIKNQKLSEKITRIAVMAGCFFLVMSLWTYRNYSISSEFVPVSTVLGYSIHQGFYTNNCTLYGDKSARTCFAGATQTERTIARNLNLKHQDGKFYLFFDTINDEIQFSRYLVRSSLSGYLADTKLMIFSALRNALRFWFGGNTIKPVVMNIILVAPFLIFYVLGLFTLRNQQHIGLPMLFVLSLYGLNLPLMTFSRHHSAVISVMAIFGGFFFVNSVLPFLNRNRGWGQKRAMRSEQ